jgi:SAM-dependent methyltransferase
VNDIYNENYFAWQRTVGDFGGKANLFKFAEHIKPSDVVLDFGCGGGYLLKNIDCARKLGVEINLAAAKIAVENGVECHSALDEISNSSINVIVSNHVLEHVKSPFGVLRKLRTKLVPGGLLIVVVPCEATTLPYDRNDTDQHIYTWNPQLLGNLAIQAGYAVVDVFTIYHKWPTNFWDIQRRFGWNIFHFLSRWRGKLKSNNFRVKLVAQNPAK